MKVEFKDVVKYKFKEDKILDDIKKYVSKTYSSHYAQTNKYQATEIIIDQGHGTGFCMGNENWTMFFICLTTMIISGIITLLTQKEGQ